MHRADYALLVACAHPEATTGELELLTDWYVWAFSGPAERAPADLWARTVPGMPPDWGHRFAEATGRLLEEPQWEQANPIDYLAARRQSGIGPWAATLIEHAIGVPLTAEIARAKPVRALRDAFADAVHLRDNGIQLFERFFGYSQQRAADTVQDLIFARLRQFDHVVHNDLPALGVDVSRYVMGLRDWQAGAQAWHLRADGHVAGSSAARIRSLLSRAGAELLSPAKPFASPNLHMPFASRSHPEVDAVRRHAAAWAMDLGMLAGDVWTSDWFYGRDFGLFSAVTYPDAELAELELINDWHIWFWYLEDLFAVTFQRTENLAGARVFAASLRCILDDPATVPGSPAERGLVDLCRRSSVDVQLAGEVGKVIDQIVNRVRRRQPDPVELLESRRAVGVFSARLIRSLLGAGPVRELEDTFADIATLNRDLYCYPHELGSRHNIVLAVQRFLDGNLTEAIKVVSDLSSSRLGRFEHLAASAPPGDPTSTSYVDRMRDWLAGHLLWHQVRIPAVMGGVRDRVVG